MQDVKMPKALVIERLKAARTEHDTIVQEAIAGYRKKAVEELESMLDAARAGRIVRFQWPLVIPEDHTADFDRVIGMLEDTTDNEIVMDETDYAVYMRNEWAWRRNFLASNSQYSSTAKNLYG